MERVEIRPGYSISRVIKGGWHLAGGHGRIDRRQADGVYEERASFAETMAATRRNLTGERAPDVLARIVQSKLISSFPDACAEFTRITGSQPLAYLAARDNAWNTRQVQALMDLVTEYRPLTEEQWARLTPAQRKTWQDVEKLERDIFEEKD